MTEPQLSVENVVADRGVAKDFIFRWIAAKCRPAQKVGKLWEFKPSEVDVRVREGDALDGRETSSKPRNS